MVLEDVNETGTETPATVGPTAAGPESAAESGLTDQVGDSVSAVAVTFSAVRGTHTPVGSPDRIPPRVDTPVVVNVAGWHPPMNFITLEVANANATNGTANINGATTAQITNSGAVNLRGLAQTVPGNGGQLQLVARIGSTVVGRSANFSVSTIQKDVSVSLNTILTGTRRGFSVDTNWGADSGNTTDLDELDFSEKVQYDAGTGPFAGIGTRNSGYLPAINQPLTDTHGAPAGLSGAGSIVAHQVFTQNDKRSGATDLVVANSGFNISRNVVEASPGVFEITTAKVGAATTAHGFSSSAGSGNVTPPAQRL